MILLDIGEVSRLSSVPPSALRYYEEIGLIRSVTRHGLRRQFEPDVLVQLKLIGLGKMAGFGLDDIAGMFGATGRPELPRDLLRDQADAIDRQIAEMSVLRDTLRHIADCRAPSHMECPTFRRLLDGVERPSAGKRRAPKPSRRP